MQKERRTTAALSLDLLTSSSAEEVDGRKTLWGDGLSQTKLPFPKTPIFLDFGWIWNCNKTSSVMESGDGVEEKPGELEGEKPSDSGGEKRDIRRPMNAFLIFCKRHRSMVREKHPDRDNRSVTRILGDLWANLANDEKAVYTNLAKQYKDAFMKANPDYKWHSTEKLPQPAKMATRPTNIRPPRSLSADCSAEGEKLAGLNLLLMAGQQSLPSRDKQCGMTHILERRMTSPDLMGANSALLQLAEMCSTELHNHQVESSAKRSSAPPKKRARHWSYSDFGHSDVGERSKLPANSLIFPRIPNPSIQSVLPSAVSIVQPDSKTQRQQDQPTGQSGAMLPRYNIVDPCERIVHSFDLLQQKMSDLKDIKPKADIVVEEPMSSMLSISKPPFQGHIMHQHSGRPAGADLRMPPKKKFTKLQATFRDEHHQSSSSAATVPAAEGGCLSDQNDNAIFTCGKLVVDHIIDRLFSANFAVSEQKNIMVSSPSTMDIEKVRKIITADMTERENSQGPTKKEVGKLLSEVVQKPQNLVEKVIEEAYTLDLKQIVKLEPSSSVVPGHSFHEPMILEESGQKARNWESISEQPGDVKKLNLNFQELTDVSKPVIMAGSPEPFQTVANEVVTVNQQSKVIPSLCDDVKEEPDDGHYGDMTDHSKDDGVDCLPEDDDSYSQPVRKSRRRNRGQRYQELINEGIIQPSKERLAARRHELVPSMNSSSSQSASHGEDRRDDDKEDRTHCSLKRSVSESDSNPSDEKRYRTGDFDLEAEIATLPPCSLDQVSRRRPQRKRSDSESSRKQFGQLATGGPPSPGQAKEENYTSDTTETVMTVSQQQLHVSEPLTGSQKRKARKHSISRLVAATDSGHNTKAYGIATSIPMVRDATVSPPRDPHPPSTAASGEPAAIATSKSRNSVTSSDAWMSEGSPSPPSEDSFSKNSAGCTEIDRLISDQSFRSLKPQQNQDLVETYYCVGKQKLCMSGCELKNSLHVQEKRDVAYHSDTAKVKHDGRVAETAQRNLSACSHKGSSVSEEDDNFLAFECKDNFYTGRADVKSTLLKEFPSDASGVVFNIADSLQQNCGLKNFSVARKSDLTWSLTHIDVHNSSAKLSVYNGAMENGGCDNKVSPKPQQPKAAFSGDSSSLYLYPENDKEENRSLNSELKGKVGYPHIFLSETSGLLCDALGSEKKILPTKACEIKDRTSFSLLASSEALKKRPESELTDNEENSESPLYYAHSPQEEKYHIFEGSSVSSTSSRHMPSSTETSDLMTLSKGSHVLVRVPSSGCFSNSGGEFSPFSSSANSTTGACLTTVTVTTTDAMPTTLSLEVLNEGAIDDAGVGSARLCAATLPGSPSMAVVHS